MKVYAVRISDYDVDTQAIMSEEEFTKFMQRENDRHQKHLSTLKSLKEFFISDLESQSIIRIPLSIYQCLLELIYQKDCRSQQFYNYSHFLNIQCKNIDSLFDKSDESNDYIELDLKNEIVIPNQFYDNNSMLATRQLYLYVIWKSWKNQRKTDEIDELVHNYIIKKIFKTDQKLLERFTPKDTILHILEISENEFISKFCPESMITARDFEIDDLNDQNEISDDIDRYIVPYLY